MSDKFEQWFNRNLDIIPKQHKGLAELVWSAAMSRVQCEAGKLNELESCIKDLEVRMVEVEKDAEIGKLVKAKMTSGNDVPVSRCTITSDEVAAIQESKGGAV